MKRSSIDHMFKGSGAYTMMPEDSMDTLLVDEAHRLNEKSGMLHIRMLPIMEIYMPQKCSVFFY